MSSLNKVMLIGNLGRDPEMRRLNNGAPVCNLSIATAESWRDKNSGERKEKTEWHRVVIFNENIAKIAEQFLRKGSKVYLEGKLQTRKWTDKDGVEKYSTEIVLQAFEAKLVLLDGRNTSGENSGARTTSTASKGTERGDEFRRSDLDDEIPF